MRDIKFRGKRIDNGEWVYGDLIHRQIWSSKILIIRVNDNGFDTYEEHEVNPDTVGQYTGLKDKNGNEICEGDIVWCYGGEYFQGHMEFNETIIIDNITCPQTMMYLAESECCEIIGNIHDGESHED